MRCRKKLEVSEINRVPSESELLANDPNLGVVHTLRNEDEREESVQVFFPTDTFGLSEGYPRNVHVPT